MCKKHAKLNELLDYAQYKTSIISQYNNYN